MKAKKPAGQKDPNGDFNAAFTALKKIFQRHAASLTVLVDKPGKHSLAVADVLHRGKPLWFGGVQIMKSYVSFHLMPVYMNPALQKQISPELKKRMQGKSCFNFTAPDPQLFRELEQLTATGLKHFRTAKFS